MAATEQDWELSKENFVPLKAGRKPGALKDVTADLRKQQLEEQRRAFWKELDSYQGDDPLEVWLRFIKWCQDAYCAGGHKAELLPLLERCTRELQGVERYRTDVRYLRVWIQYADCLPDPADVFAFLKEKDIGQEHALFYIAHATYLEFRGAYARADTAYQQGINRLAAPVERLRAKYADFQHRMARRIQRKAAEQLEQGSEVDHPERKTLGVLGGRGGGRCAPRPLGGGLLGGGAGLKRKADAENRLAGGGLSIYEDEECAAAAAAGPGPALSAPAFFNPGRSAAGAAWGGLAGFEATRKENMARPGVWAGQRVRQAAAHSAPAAAPLEIFEDPELAEGGVGGADADAARHSPKLSLRQRLDRPGATHALEEELVAHPLCLHKAQPAAALALPGTRGPKAGGLALPGPDPKRRREEHMAFDESALTSADGEELSFEEVRAARWKVVQAEQSAARACTGAVAAAPAAADGSIAAGPEAVQDQAYAEESASPTHGAAEAGALGTDAPSGGLEDEEGAQQEQALQEPATAALLKPTLFDQLVERITEAEAAGEPTMTLSTRDAFAAINEMFRGSMGGSAAVHAAPLLAMQAPLEPTVTIATRDAFAAVNQMFRGGLPAESGGCVPLHPGAEPTMSLGDANLTLSTKNAFAAINRMFKGALPTEHSMLPPTSFSEPTVTISTQEAFAAINSMFAGPPHAAQPAAAQPSGAGDFRAPAPRPPRSRSDPQPLGGGTGGALEIREDTQFVRPGQLAAAAAAAAAPAQRDSGGLFVREDTEFVFSSAAAQKGASPALPAGAGFSIREDTQFIAVAPQASPPVCGGFSIREDTQFIQPQPQRPAAPLLAAETGGGGGFLIRDATQLLAGTAASPSSSAGVSAGCSPLQQRLDAAGSDLSPLSDAGGGAGGGAAEQISKWGFAPGREDTMALDLGGDTQALLLEVEGAKATAGGSALERSVAGAASTPSSDAALPLEALHSHMQGLYLSEAKENLVLEQPAAAPAAGVGRNIRDAAAAASALQPLSDERAACVGVDVLPSEEAEDALALGLGVTALEGAASIPADDSFDVFASSSSTNCGAESVEQVQPAEQQRADQVSAGEGPTVDPFRPSFQPQMLASLDPPVTQWEGVSSVAPEGESAAEAGFREAARSGAGLVELWFGGREFAVSGCVGEGAYARVYQGVDGDCADVALKVEAPPCPWEWYICKALQGRVPLAARHLFIDPQALLLGECSSVLVLPLGAHGSLQAALNLYLMRGQPPPEVVALHFAAELLRMLGALAAARVIHADVKPDNLLVALRADASGDENAVPGVGLQLIDFGRSVDLELLPPGTQLCGDSDTDSFRCVEMRERRPWLWQADAYGVAAVVHCLLFGDYMEVERVAHADSGETFLRLRRPFKRHFAANEVWEELFHALLNKAGAKPPSTEELLARVERHLAGREAAQRRRQELGRLVAMLQARV